MPGAVPYTSTQALTNMTLPYIVEISEKGWKEAVRSNNEIKEGLNIISGRVVNKNVSEAFNVEYFNLTIKSNPHNLVYYSKYLYHLIYHY